MVRKEGKSIFACDHAAVYGDAVADLGGGMMVTKVEDGMYKQVWKTFQRRVIIQTMTGLSKQMQSQSVAYAKNYMNSLCVIAKTMLANSKEALLQLIGNK